MDQIDRKHLYPLNCLHIVTARGLLEYSPSEDVLQKPTYKLGRGV